MINSLLDLYRQGNYAALEKRTHLLIDQYPDFGFGWKLLGGALQMQGKNALHAFQKAAQLMPREAESHYNLGVVQKSLGLLEEAAASYRQALQIKPDYAEAHYNLGNVLKDLGNFDKATASYRQTVKLKPDFALAHYNLGVVLQSTGYLDDAAASYRRALALIPGNAVIHNDLGNTLLALGRLDEAMASYRRAIEIKPDFALAHNNLGNPLKNLGRFDEAIASYRRALEIKPDFAEALCNLAAALKSTGDIPAARTCYRKAGELGYSAARVCDALMLPAIMGTQAEVMESRAGFERNLDKLIEDRVKLADPLNEVDETNFYLAFHGLNDRDLQVKVAGFYAQACPSLLYTAPHCTKPGSGGNIRIGFLSRYLYSHSVSLCFSRIIETLSVKEPFEASLISNHPIDMKTYAGFSGKRVRLPYNLASAREMIAALELDVLIYLDIGMEPLSYFLAFARLARVQCVLAGHPVTTGIANMDYFLSTDQMEPDNADAHYSEKLIRLPRPPVYFGRPELPDTLKSRSDLGLPDGRHIYMCPMKLQKLHPDFDEAIARILLLDRQGVVVLFEDHQFPSWKSALLNRFDKTIPAEVRERILFLPWLKDKADFISAIATADVILDPFHFGIGSTAATTCVTGTPFVTKTGEFMRGRVGAYYCVILDLPECIAEDTESYVQKAVQIASNPSLRDSIRARMLKNSSVLYDNMQPVDDLAELFHTLAAGRNIA